MGRLNAARMSSTDAAPPDAELMRRVAAGSGEALAMLHRRFARPVFRILSKPFDIKQLVTHVKECHDTEPQPN